MSTLAAVPTTDTPGAPSTTGLSEAAVSCTADFIASVQQPTGQIPWSHGGHTDPWNHLEAAMGLTVAGRHAEADAAVDWLCRNQRADGSWPMRWDGDHISMTEADSNFTSYLATAEWHRFCVTGNTAAAQRTWPTVHRAITYVAAKVRPDGTIPWAINTAGGETKGALRTGCASIVRSIDSALRLAKALDIKPLPHDWVAARNRCTAGLRHRSTSYLSRRRFAMDWYYPVLSGALSASDAATHLNTRWAEFVQPGYGCRCVTDEPWATSAETSELVIALCAAGQRAAAAQLFDEVQYLRADNGSYWTGYAYHDHTLWPQEQTTWSAGAVLLAHDAVTQHTPGHDVFTRPHTQ